MGTSLLPAVFFSARASALAVSLVHTSGSASATEWLTVVPGLGELMNGRRHFESMREESLLPLQPVVAGPFNKAGEVPSGLDVLFSSKILRPFLKHGTYHLLDLLPLHDSRT